MKLFDFTPKNRLIPYSGKIADINEADTNKHTLDLETILGETRKILGVLVDAKRQAGTGYLYFYPNEGTLNVTNATAGNKAYLITLSDATQRLQYSQTVANDDFDCYCFGYVVEV